MYIVLSSAGFGCNDALIKLAAADFPLFQAVFIRGLFVTLLVVLLMWQQKTPWQVASRADRKLVSLRMAAEVCSTICFLNALFNMPIANVTAVLQATPIAVTLCAALVLGEKIGWRRYLAILVGFVGVIILIQPGTDAFNRYSLWALAAVGFLVLRELSTRRLSAQTPSLLVTLCTAVAIATVAGLACLGSNWQPLAIVPLLLLIAAAFFLLGGYLFGIMAMRCGDIGFVSPFRYSIMLWAIVLGYGVFGEIPNATTLLGTAIVAATGIYTFYRETRARAAVT